MNTCSVRFTRGGNEYTYRYHPDITPISTGDMVLVNAGGKLSVVQVASVPNEDQPHDSGLKVVLAIIDSEQVLAVTQREKGVNS